MTGINGKIDYGWLNHSFESFKIKKYRVPDWVNGGIILEGGYNG